ncbi:MAG: phage minor head protein [Negativicutes bacterium]|nr:phage minor head protein [Negativicutes bacterium]
MSDFEVTLKPLKFKEALAFFKTRVALTPEQYTALQQEVRLRAFTISGITSLDVLQSILNALTKAIEDGTTMEEFRSSANASLEKAGWKGLSPYRADNLFRTNIQTAYSIGRYKQQTDPDVVVDRPYFEYDAVNDKRTRPSHAALSGVVRRHDDPFWDTWYPPNGFRCRCSVRSITQREVDKSKITVESGPAPVIRKLPNGPAIPVNPDPGFDNNPAKQAWEPDLSKYPPSLRDVYLERQAKGSD